MKLYTEEQVRKAIALGYDWCYQKHIPDDLMIDNFIKSLNLIKLPTDDEIGQEFKHSSENWEVRQALEEGAKWMRDKIQGGNK